MGSCYSAESADCSTAKVIMNDGKLHEFHYPVRVSYVLGKNPTYFICNSDDLDFDQFISALKADDKLEMGHLYFVLPLNKLKIPIKAEEMAELAVKASSALPKARKCGKVQRRKEGIGFREEEGEERRKRRAMAGGGRKFTSTLCVISE